jgi:4-hydroxymandelate synthase
VAGYADFYHDAVGFHRSASDNDTDGDGVRDSMVIRSRSERITFALVAPDPLRSPGELDAFLARNGGPGVRRLVFSADRHDPVAHAFEGRAVAYGTVGE